MLYQGADAADPTRDRHPGVVCILHDVTGPEKPGGDRGGRSPPGPINSIFRVGPGGPNI